MELISRYLFLILLYLPGVFYAQTKNLIISNPTNFARPDELIILRRQDLEKSLGSIERFVSVSSGGKVLTVQNDDMDRNGKWDEVAFLYSFQPKEKATITIQKTNENNFDKALQRAHVRLKKKNPDDSWSAIIPQEQMPFQNPATDFSKQPLPLYLTEGPAWENDKLGFRLYFDVRNGKDIWGKRISSMVLDSVGTKVEPTYHDLHDWGMDVLHVGKSLGAGGLALMIPQPGSSDTLLRIGGNAVVKTTYTQIANGPVRAIFEMDYELEVWGHTIHVYEQMTIWGGQFFYESKVVIAGAPAGTKLVTGIANFYDNTFRSFNDGKCSVLLSHGRQSENKDYLGMAVLVPNNNTLFVAASPNENSEILNTYLAVLTTNKTEPSVFRFYAAWEKTEPRFDSINFFSDMLRTESRKLDHPVKIIFNSKASSK
jgi:hypothetical protein